MRKITQEATNAFYARMNFSKANMLIETSENEVGQLTTYMSLHNNVIAKLDTNGDLWITNAGWSTNTTKERLNSLYGVSIVQRDYVWYLNGKEWNGEWIKID